MEKQSLKSQILEEVRLRQYCPLDIIHELARKGGYKQSTSEKKCRELCEDGYITTLYNEKGYVRAFTPCQRAEIAPTEAIDPKKVSSSQSDINNAINAKQGVLI
jgi:hypothetical protein